LSQNFNQDTLTEYLGIEVPFIEKEPIFEQYNLTPGSTSDLERIDALSVARQKAFYGLIAILICICVLIANVIFSLFDIFSVLALLLVFVGLPYFVLNANIKPKTTDLHIRLRTYFEDKKNWEYWVRKKQKDYWRSLDGHSFEHALASVLRKVGYVVDVSKAGGDGGIDLVLRKDGQVVAVQCKAHVKQIGPVVARELLGTMHHFGYTSGWLVSVSGFSGGVYDFVKDKPIKLVQLDEIISLLD
jgi:hypothetical protein